VTVAWTPNRRVGDVSPAMVDPNAFDVLTFDCYGTLVDWESGLLAALRPVLAAHGAAPGDEEILELHGSLESREAAGAYRAYREILGRVLDGMGARWGFTPRARERAAFASSVGEWPVFPDVPDAMRALSARYALGVVSNVDDDLFAATAAKLGARLDWVVTAQQVGAYKPSPRNFERAIARAGVPRGRILHVAQSKYHDVAPARALGLATVWVDRRHARPGAGATPRADAEADLVVRDLAELAHRLVAT
jgi:2-haloacid dehalogenase